MKVEVYSASWCIWCKKLKEWLRTNNVKFETRDVQNDQEAAHELLEVSGQSAIPVTVVDGEIIIGFDESALRKALKLK